MKPLKISLLNYMLRNYLNEVLEWLIKKEKNQSIAVGLVFVEERPGS